MAKAKPSKSIDAAVAAVQSAMRAYDQAQADYATLFTSLRETQTDVDNAFHDLQASKDALIAAALKAE